MFRLCANPAGRLIAKSRPLKRPYSTGTFGPAPHVRLLGPVVWSVAACSTIYLGCAAYEVYFDAKRARAEALKWPNMKPVRTFADLERMRSAGAVMDSFHGSTSERPEFSGDQNMTVSAMALALSVFVSSSIYPSMAHHFQHTPALSTNYTLLTSVFGHSGLIHLGFNMYVMSLLIPTATDSKVFNESNAHLTAFYLSAGILSSLAHHATAVWPGGGLRAYTPALGASGALFALFGIVGVSFPHMHVGILFLPGSVPIGHAMVYVALFDAIGILVRYPFISLGHGSHLGGLALGFAYAKYGGDEKIWRPGRKIAFTAMRSLGVV
ncbi:hypothetical protein F5Y10DRAFT_81015 [Nemania abortiva]|nr:hypothetical protein F5Y10DRAFT_81015 [Nemania abortiva]